LYKDDAKKYQEELKRKDEYHQNELKDKDERLMLL
jgi:hypothetical protein